jgi:hypothetical protein
LPRDKRKRRKKLRRNAGKRRRNCTKRRCALLTQVLICSAIGVREDREGFWVSSTKEAYSA